MTTIKTETLIEAPVDVVFNAISDVRNFAKAVPHITNVDFLTEQQVGVGTRFRETRLMKGREATTELEVRDYVENEKVQMVSDAGGTIWDTVFTVAQQGDATNLVMTMDCKPYKFMARIITPLIKGMVTRAVMEDMAAVKRYCES